MKLMPWMLVALALVPAAAPASVEAPVRGQDGNKWKPYQFVGNEKFEYKMLSMDGDDRKETLYALDLRKKGEEDFDVTYSFKTPMKKSQGAEIVMGGLGMGFSPALMLMNPLYGAFLEQLELKEGEKMSLFGAGFIKVVKKETVGGRTGFYCELYTKQEDKDVLTWAWTVDPALALPIKSITIENGKEKYRAELVRYTKD